MEALANRELLNLSHVPRLPRYGAICGSALITTAQAITSSGRELDYLEFSAFADFVETLLLHDNLVIIGELDNEELAYIDSWNRDFNDQVIIAISPDDLGQYVETESVDRELNRLLTAAFGNDAPALSWDMLSERPEGLSRAAWQRARFAEKFRSMFTWKDNIVDVDDDRLASFLLSELRAAYTDSDRRYTVYNIYRVFLIASLARVQAATAVADGLRKPVLGLLERRMGVRVAATLAKRLYDLTNEVYRSTRESATFNRLRDVPLALGYVATMTTQRAEMPSALVAARATFEPFRRKLASFDRVFALTAISDQERASSFLEFAGSAAAYLEGAVELLVRNEHADGFAEKLAKKLLESVMTKGHYDTSGKKEFVAELSTNQWLSALRSMIDMYKTAQRENEVKQLLDLVRTVAEYEGVNDRLDALFPLRVGEAERGVSLDPARTNRQPNALT